jgi:hypothetical protein
LATVWNHPELGEFVYDSYAWTKTISMPAFAAFSCQVRYGAAPRPSGVYRLAFITDTENETPSPAAVALAEKVLANQEALVEIVIRALWEDFQGDSWGTGMWWSGDLEAVSEGLDLEKPLTEAADLLPLLRMSQVSVHESLDSCEKRSSR